MTRSRFIAAFVIVGVLLGAVAYNLRQPSQPSHQGRGINAWLRELNSAISRNDFQKRHEAEKAVQAIGAQAAPYIVAHLRRSNSVWRRNYRNLFPKLPAWLQGRIPSPREEFTFFTGNIAFFAIGAPAKPALIRGLRDYSPEVRMASAHTLGALAHYDIRDSVPALIECLRDTDAGVRCCSALTLGSLGPDAVAAIPGLISLLKDPQTTNQGRAFMVRSAAARALGKIGHPATSALPALRATLTDPEPYDRGIAAIAIWRIEPKVTNTLPVLIEALSLVPDGPNNELYEGLGEMGARMGVQAKEAFPVLLKELTVRRTSGVPLNPVALQKITNALIRIDPEAAARAGVRPAAADGPARPR